MRFCSGSVEQRRVDDAVQTLVADQRLGDALRVLALPVHAQGDRGQAAVEHPALVGLEDVAEHAAPAAELLDHVADLW